MMRVKIREVGKGLHPSEVVVVVSTTEGQERLIVDRRSIKDDSLEVGYPIDFQDNQYLVELPRETTTGSWRVWVNEDNIIPQKEGAAA